MSNALPASTFGTIVHGVAHAARTAAPLVAMLAALPAHAQLPRASASPLSPVAVSAPVVIDLDAGVDGSPLTLVANHVDIRVTGTLARVRTTLTWRNDGAQPVAAKSREVLPPTQARLIAADEIDACDDPIDAVDAIDRPLAQARADEIGETGDVMTAVSDTVTLAPGDEVSVTVEREATLIARADHHRLVLPLSTRGSGLFTPRFSATAFIDAARPIVALDSATHPVEVAFLGQYQALVVIPDGRVHEGGFLALEFTLGSQAPPASRSRPTALHWGGETFTRLAAH